MRETLENALLKERELEQVLDGVKEELVEKIKEQPSHVRFVDGDHNIGIVSSKDLNGNWSPVYHLPNAQADTVRREITSAPTVTAFMKKVTDLSVSERTRENCLNKETVRILREFIE